MCPLPAPALQQRGCVSLGGTAPFQVLTVLISKTESAGGWRGGNELEKPFSTLPSVSLEEVFWSQSCRIPNGCWGACLLLAPGPSSARLSWFSLLTWQRGGVFVHSTNTQSKCPHVLCPALVGRAGGILQRQRMARRGQGEDCRHSLLQLTPGRQDIAGTKQRTRPCSLRRTPSLSWASLLIWKMPSLDSLTSPDLPSCTNTGGHRKIQTCFCPQGVQPMFSPLLT